MSKLIAYCTNNTCSGKKTCKNTSRGVKLDVPKHTIDCPYCKHALLWVIDMTPGEAKKRQRYLRKCTFGSVE